MKSIVALLCTLLYIESSNGHGFMVSPRPRNLVHKGGSKGPGDVQGMAGGGPAADRARGHGLCGDNVERSEFMAPNAYGPTAPVATYKQGAYVDIQVKITAHHWGWFEFRLCRPKDGGKNLSLPITQECLNEHVLEFDVDHAIKKYGNKMRQGVKSPADYVGNPKNYGIEHAKCAYIPGRGPHGSCCKNGGKCSPENRNTNRWVLPRPDPSSSTYTMRYKLPKGVVCERCVLQWYYQTGNSIDSYPEGFWNCADIAISATGAPVNNETFPTEDEDDEDETEKNDDEEGDNETPKTTVTKCVSTSHFMTDSLCQKTKCVCTMFCKKTTVVVEDDGEEDDEEEDDKEEETKPPTLRTGCKGNKALGIS
eukprot:CAMPEP_0203754432 /NCGR_PEP_ID=MMETSP0098-20131031/8018_1 /ASSEMBLY_ACC=CAM_ASM_000208 /TAXON_ID=96639 /ORGANISM=" , Strain NY0313808BC1" /LENGTH=365 /DNA_ID=CAMNT_0050645427 /DNA_START=751 /DNA_END=1845 /DNA_ORIENTATION=+